MKNIFIGLLFGFMLGAVVAASAQDTDTTYYQPAEVVAYNDTSVYFATPDNNVFHIEMDSTEYPDTVPYLLDIDNMGTDDVSDDEIIVVWRCAK